jgi:aminoglycoside phosphotransferase family enzyme
MRAAPPSSTCRAPAAAARSPSSLAAKVAFLSRPQSYPGRPRAVEPLETHMSWVFLADDRVYKLKKPVRYDFLDFSTVELRRLNCHREVRLNRRLAPDVYLGLVPLALDPRGRLHLGGNRFQGTAVDWLVSMRRLPAERMLDRRIAGGTVGREEVRRLGLALARFYRRQPPVAMTTRAYRRRFRAEVEEIRRQLTIPADTLPRSRVLGIADGLLGWLDGRGELLDARVAGRRVLEAHGDLRPQHVCLTDPPVVIDCLEFRRDFRLLDPADELAYLALECDRLGAAWIGERLFAVYGDVTGDRPDPALLSFYRAFRAFLRGKIAYLHIREPELGDPRRWVALTRRYLDLAAERLAALA